MKRIPVLCSQEYEGSRMRVTPCTRCRVGWSEELGECMVPTGCEHLPLEDDVPNCPISDRCRHQIQRGNGPCAVRARGMVCESALAYAGVEGFANHPLGFNADCVASEETLHDG
jgi:hypothetical protein